MTNEFFPDLRTVRLDEPGGAVVILDQTRLPGEETYVELRTPEQIWEAIRELKVRGAPAIGVTAGLRHLRVLSAGRRFLFRRPLRNIRPDSRLSCLFAADGGQSVGRAGAHEKLPVGAPRRTGGRNMGPLARRGRGDSARGCRRLPADRRVRPVAARARSGDSDALQRRTSGDVGVRDRAGSPLSGAGAGLRLSGLCR